VDSVGDGGNSSISLGSGIVSGYGIEMMLMLLLSVLQSTGVILEMLSGLILVVCSVWNRWL
jgi:hypothetical protein